MNLICGINPVLEALNAGTRHFDRLLIVKGIRNRRVSEAIARASRKGIPLRFEARETLDRMAGGVPHQGVIAVVSAKPALSLDSLLEHARTPALLVVLDGVEDPRNLGAILRTAEAAGADGVVLPERHSAGLSETVNRASAGGLEHVAVARVGNVAQALEHLKSRGFWVVGFDAAGTERWDAIDYRRPIALVLGGEGRGIRRLVRERCDHLASLPLFGHVASLNVSVVAGVALYEAIRQRGAVPSQVRPIPLTTLANGSKKVIGPAPDDAEDDPGARPSERHALAEEGAFEGEGEGDELDERAPLNLVHIHEEAAWAHRGPAERSSRWAGPGAPSHQSARASDEKRRAPASSDAPERSASSGGADRSGRPDPRRRRRRRGHRPAVPPEPRSEARSADTPSLPAAVTPDSSAATEGSASQPAAPHHGRRRRRRRR
jgi:23S rRNA (guanosine2251-2'-O)-methyltransferase